MSNIKLLHGDCYELIQTVEDNSIDLTVCDPPYEFVSARGSGFYSKGALKERTDKLNDLDCCTFNPEKFLNLLLPKMKKFYGYFFCSKFNVTDYILWAKEHGFSFDILVLMKSNPPPAHNCHHVNELEYVILIRDKGTFFRSSGLDFDNYRKTYSVMCGKKKIHPAEKPVEFLERFIRVSSPEEAVIFDPFMGSGSTGIAALNNRRNFIGIEKSDEYFELSSKRIKEREDEINGVGSLFEGVL